MLVTLLVLVARTGNGAIAETGSAPADGERVGTVGDAEDGAAPPSLQQVMEEFTANAGTSSVPGVSAILGAPEMPNLRDFILPGEIEDESPEPHLLRRPMERWSDQQVRRYWIPPRDIALDLIRVENDRRIEKLFEDIP